MQSNIRSSDGGAPWERRHSRTAEASAMARLGTRTTLERAALQLRSTDEAFSSQQRRALQSQGIEHVHSTGFGRRGQPQSPRALQRWNSQGELSVSGTRATGVNVSLSTGVPGNPRDMLPSRQTGSYSLQNTAASHDSGRAVASRADILMGRTGGSGGGRPPLPSQAPAPPVPRWSTSSLGLTLRSRVQRRSNEQGNANWARSLMGKLSRDSRDARASTAPLSPQRDGERSAAPSHSPFVNHAAARSAGPRRRSPMPPEHWGPTSPSPSRVSWTDRDGSESVGWGESVDGEEGSGSGSEDDSVSEGGESQYGSSVQSSRQGRC